MPMPKRKPDYQGAATMQELLEAVCAFYGDPVDDRKQEDAGHISLHEAAAAFDITVMKARKLLITGGLYSTALSRKVQKLHAQGMTAEQISEETDLGRASINSYLPYTHIAYNLPDISIQAERQKQYRVRQRNRARTDAEKEETLWQELIYLQGCIFTTGNGINFTYRIRGSEMFVDGEEKGIPRVAVMKAYRKVVGRDTTEEPENPEASVENYLYPVFAKMGLIRRGKA